MSRLATPLLRTLLHRHARLWLQRRLKASSCVTELHCTRAWNAVGLAAWGYNPLQTDDTVLLETMPFPTGRTHLMQWEWPHRQLLVAMYRSCSDHL